MLKYRISFLIFLAVFILQSTVLNFLRIFDISPNLILCLVIIFSFLYEGYHGIVYGLAFGFLFDICFGKVIGIAPFSYLAAALVCIGMKRYLYKDSMVSVLIVTSAGTAVYALVYWSLYSMLGGAAAFGYAMEKNAVLLACHAVINVVIYYFVRRSVVRHPGDRYMYRGNLQEARSLNRS